MKDGNNTEPENSKGRKASESGALLCVLYCPQCGGPTEELHEGYCEECCQQNQMELDYFNTEYEYWNRMSNVQREEAIRRGYI